MEMRGGRSAALLPIVALGRHLCGPFLESPRDSVSSGAGEEVAGRATPSNVDCKARKNLTRHVHLRKWCLPFGSK